MKSFVLEFFIAARFANASQFHCLSTNSPATGCKSQDFWPLRQNAAGFLGVPLKA
jgi:hypothetical protein